MAATWTGLSKAGTAGAAANDDDELPSLLPLGLALPAIPTAAAAPPPSPPNRAQAAAASAAPAPVAARVPSTLPAPAAAASAAPAPAPRPAAAAPPGGAAVSASGYPTQPLIDVHLPSGAAAAGFKAAAASGARERSLVFKLRPKDDRVDACGSTAATLTVFLSQFDSFTSFAFAAMTPAAWSNVVVAGGAVLASLMPLEACFRQMAPPVLDETRFFRRSSRGSDATARLDAMAMTHARFLTEVRQPKSDVDVFVYGLDAETADMKVLTLLSLFSKAYKARGATNVTFVRTTNTVTVDSGLVGVRKIQIILRLYGSEAEVLNGFDIDCCCFGYDGTRVQCTERARAAIVSKINVVDLTIRGAAYENRLIKYASRWFAISVPELDKSRIDSKNIAVKVSSEGGWGGTNFVGDGFSWSKWEDSRGSLLRILLMEQIALRIGYLDEPFGSRAKREPHTAEVVDRFYMFRPGSDTYTSSGDVLHGTYPATFDIASLVGPRALPRLKLVWQAGNMPRQPLTFEAWAEGVYHDPTRAKRHAYHYDPAAAAKARATRERAEAAKAEAEEEAQEAKREAIRGQGRAALEEQQRKNRGVEAELKAARAEAAVAQRAAAIAQAAAHAAAAAAAAGGGADGNECCVCLLKPKEYMMAPCLHVSMCFNCARDTRIVQCPVCRGPHDRNNSKRVFLS